MISDYSKQCAEQRGFNPLNVQLEFTQLLQMWIEQLKCSHTLTSELQAHHVDVTNYLSLKVLERKGITEPTERQIRCVEVRLRWALRRVASCI